MNNPILAAFGRTDLVAIYDRPIHRIDVIVGERVVGHVEPERAGYHEMAYAREYRGVTRNRHGPTPIGPAFDPGTMRRRLVSVMFNGDADAFAAARLEVVDTRKI